VSLVFPGLTCRIYAGSSSLFGVCYMRQRNGKRAVRVGSRQSKMRELCRQQSSTLVTYHMGLGYVS